MSGLKDWLDKAGARMKTIISEASKNKPTDDSEALFQMLAAFDEAMDIQKQSIKAVLDDLKPHIAHLEVDGVLDGLARATARLDEAQIQVALCGAALKEDISNQERRAALLKALGAAKEAKKDQLAALAALRVLTDRP